MNTKTNKYLSKMYYYLATDPSGSNFHAAVVDLEGVALGFVQVEFNVVMFLFRDPDAKELTLYDPEFLAYNLKQLVKDKEEDEITQYAEFMRLASAHDGYPDDLDDRLDDLGFSEDTIKEVHEYFDDLAQYAEIEVISEA